MKFFDQLESRQMFSSSISNGVLTLTGTAKADNFYLNAAPGNKINVYEGGKTTSYARGSFKSIIAKLDAGDDQLFIGMLDNIPVKADGGAGNDNMSGGYGNDTLIGGVGNDIINGAAGNDQIDAGDGNDQLAGGNGNDTLLGGAGYDLMGGLAGDDLLDGGIGSDRIAGDQGIDTVTYASRTKAVFVDLSEAQGELADDGEAGEKDFVYSTVEVVIGGAGNDVLVGSTPSKIPPMAYSNKNTLIGGAGNDTLSGLDGDDILKGGVGNDILNGGIGNDSLYGEAGADKLFGQDGNDSLFDKSTPAEKDSLDGGAGTDKAQTDTLDTKTSVESVIA